MPDILAHGQWRSGEELNAIAGNWLAVVRESLDRDKRPIAVALSTTPESVALLVGLSSLLCPVILLSPEVRAWRTDPPIPSGTLVVLLPSLGHLTPDAEKLGLVPLVLPEPSTRAVSIGLEPFSGAGVVLFTSGSSGPPKPVFHRMRTQLASMENRIRAMGLGPGAGLVMEASPAYAQGYTYLLTTLLLGGPLGILDPRDHRGALAALAEPVFHCWRATPHFVDALS